MTDSYLGSIWHDLKYRSKQDRLEDLRGLGHGSEADHYEELWEKDQKEAKTFARTMEESLLHRKSAPDLNSATPFRTGLSHAKKTIYVLVVDDQKKMRDRLEDELSIINRDITEFELKLRFASNVAGAETALNGEDLQAIILDYLLTDSDYEDGADAGRESIELSKVIARERPGLPVFGLTGRTPKRISNGSNGGWLEASPEWVVERVFYKHDAGEVHELLLTIVRSIRERAATPFFTALKTYSEFPTTVFHALPLSRSKSVATSQWTREFFDFYGAHYFAGETSSTMAPLDSIFGPKRSLRAALEMAARAFHAERTLFVTNGTTGANSIVYRALVHPGDVVLLDRNCHRSHHYAALQSGAGVVYMEPEHIDEYGISSIVSMNTIENTVRNHTSARLLALTHPTFDGVCYNPYEVMRRVHAINPQIAFLFDEAWFAYGAFHPSFRKYSAMVAAERLWSETPSVSVRVYVTQSTHKTLSALRQGSMIHIRDPWLIGGDREDILKLSIEEAQIAFTTTSPNIHILASLDVARMQAELEGYDSLSRALEISQRVRDALNVPNAVRVLTADELQSEILRREGSAALDPLKLTLHSPHMSGSAFREEHLYGKCGIQVNKTSHNTALALVTIGTTYSMADHLIGSIRKWRPETSESHYKSPGKIPRFSSFAAQFCTDAGAGDLSRAYHSSLIPGRSAVAALGKSGSSDAVGRVSAGFVTPYPPGYPILVPGQWIEQSTVDYLRSLREAGVDEIHGLQKRDPISHESGDFLWVMSSDSEKSE